MSQARSPFKIIFQDRDLLAVHKPIGMATYQNFPPLGLKEQLEASISTRLFPVHRIDADTEGLVLFALSSKIAAALTQQFQKHLVKKTYRAWCVGRLPKTGSIRTPLVHPKTGKAESARTDYAVLREIQKSGKTFSEIQAFPTTGRFHQIRRHLLGIDHPLVGDSEYGNSKEWASFFPGDSIRLMLFAEAIEFTHPVHQHQKLLKLRPWPTSSRSRK